MRKLKLTTLPAPMWPASVQVALDDDSLPDDIIKLVKEGNVKLVKEVLSTMEVVMRRRQTSK